MSIFKLKVVILLFRGLGKKTQIPNDSNDYYRIKYPNGTNRSGLTDYLREIQKNSFYSELPEFNYVTVSAEHVEFIPLKAEEFIKYFFGDNGKLLCQFIGEFEKQKEESKPF